MAAYGTLVTNIGEALIANNFLQGKKIDITQLAVGDGGGGYYLPTPNMTTLKNEVWRGKVNSVEISETSPNVVLVSAYIPADVGGFTIREAAIFDADGNMIAVMNTPDTQKVTLTEGAQSELYVNMPIAVSYTDSIKFITDPTIIIASKADIEKHNTMVSSHSDIRALLTSQNEALAQIETTLTNKANQPLLINRFLQVWGRGTTITNPVNTYIADRLKLDGNGTFSARLGADNKPIGGAIITGNIDCRYLMEHIDFEWLDGRELTFSYSVDGHVTSNTFIANVGNCPFDGDGRRIAAFSPGAGTLNWFNLDIGDRAAPFIPRPIAEELALCQRYYQVFYAYNRIDPRQQLVWINDYIFCVSMRTAPTITLKDWATNNTLVAGSLGVVTTIDGNSFYYRLDIKFGDSWYQGYFVCDAEL